MTRSTRLAVLLLGAGAAHFAVPGFYDPMIPRQLPGSARTWTYGSGVVELAVGAAVLHPRTRRRGAWAAVALFVGVFPANVQMVLDAKRPSARAVLLARLPLQVPMVTTALKVARD